MRGCFMDINNRDPYLKRMEGKRSSIIATIIIGFYVLVFIVVIVSCSLNYEEYPFYPDFNSSTYIEAAEKEIKSELYYPSKSIFSGWEAEAYEENGEVFVMASGKVRAMNSYGSYIDYMYYVKFKVDVENNTYTPYKPIRTLY